MYILNKHLQFFSSSCNLQQTTNYIAVELCRIVSQSTSKMHSERVYVKIIKKRNLWSR